VSASQAFDAQMNRNFHAKLQSAGVPHTFREIDGGHVFSAVQATVPMLFEFMAAHLK
jgi:S-formylglutathione hydrolase FrmB